MKRFLAIVLTIISVFAISAFALGCGENKYTVTLLYPDGTAVNGTTDGISEGDDYFAVSIQVCTVDENGEQNQCSNPMEVGADGKVTFTKDDLPVLNDGEKYKLKVARAPEGYSANEVYLESNTVTITLIQD